MDHHDEWAQWPEDEHGLGDADTADLDNHLGDAGGHDHLGDADRLGGGYGDLDGYDAQPDEPAPDLGHISPAPDLMHDGDPGHDDPGHDGDPDLGHAAADPGPHDGPPDPAGHDALDHDAAGHDAPGRDAADHDPRADEQTDGGHDPTPHAGGYDDGVHQPPVEHLVGTDPDLPAEHHGFHDGDFPPPLDLAHRPEPADGYPWADPDTLGHPDALGADAGDPVGYAPGGDAPVADLFAYAGIDAAAPGTDPWHLLLASDDPATSSLARFWGPPGE